MGAHFDIAAIKAALPLSEVVRLSVAFDARRSDARRGDFWACCPFHGERTPSFHVDDRKGFFHCFGCSASGDHVDWCRHQYGDDFKAALERLAGLAGVAPEDRRAERRRPGPRPADPEAERRARDRLASAMAIWREARESSPLLADYLAARGVDIDAVRATWDTGLPPMIRFHPALPHRAPPGGPVVHSGPAMVALVSRPGFAAGIHRTWITAGGRATLDGEKIPKQWLGLTGAMLGIPVRITPAGARMIVGEGIETTLAAWSHLQARHLAGRGDDWSAEAALSLGALTGGADPRFRGPRSPATGRPLSSAVPDFARPAWVAPDCVEHLVILAEGSTKDPSEAARRAWTAQRRHSWRSDGTARRCELRLPPGGWGSGRDFADLAAEAMREAVG